jgi:hypothetical protein
MRFSQCGLLCFSLAVASARPSVLFLSLAGAYGVVISALNRETGQKVAIKKMTPMAETKTDGVHALREIRLMRCVRWQCVSMQAATPGSC